jgi:hypothetical protein
MKENTLKLILSPASYFLALILITLISACSEPDDEKALIYPTTLPDLSGLSWVEDDLFIGVHDAKNNAEKENWPRISLIRLPQSELDGVIWEPVALNFPGPGGVSSDMESACSLPGGKEFLFVESGQEGEQYRRIFYAEYDNGAVIISSYTDWPVEIVNVEATEVCLVGEKLVFLYAERAQDSSSTQLRWAELSISPLGFGEFEELTYEAIDPVGPGARPIVAIDVDSDGFIYIVSAYDSGSDNGPYRSVVWQIGQVIEDGQGNPAVELGLNNRLADLDGLKVESIAIRELAADSNEIYIGTDDEHYGGILRLLPGSEGRGAAKKRVYQNPYFMQKTVLIHCLTIPKRKNITKMRKL